MSFHGHPTLPFLGAAGTVSGSRFFIEWGRRRILVDGGLSQGFKQLTFDLPARKGDNFFQREQTPGTHR